MATTERGGMPGPPEPGARPGTVVCPVCLMRVAERSKKCPNCGEPLRKRRRAQTRRRGCMVFMLVTACLLGLAGAGLWRAAGRIEARQERDRAREAERQKSMAWTELGDITIGRNTRGCREPDDLGRPRAGDSCLTLPVGATAYPQERDSARGLVRVRLAGQSDLWWIEAN